MLVLYHSQSRPLAGSKKKPNRKTPVKMPSQKTRAYIYRVLVALGAIALLYGWVSDTELVVYLGLAGTILGNGLASANTSTQLDS
jgi:hypothetical protein